MATSTITITATGSEILEDETPLLDDVVLSSVDLKGRPAVRSKSGCWKSASFIIGVEMAERFAYYGIMSNLISYLTGPLGQSTAAAAANVNAWSGTAFLSPLLGAFIADSFLGRYRTIIVASMLYILGLGFLTLSAALYSSNSSDCKSAFSCMAICVPSQLRIIFFFFSLYLVALAQGGHKPCILAFGAEQFDDNDEKECRAKSSFFNWWTFCLCVSILVSLLLLSYIQENMSWELAFGIPAIAMSFALIVFLLGSITYRFNVKGDERNPFVRISLVFVEAVKNRHAAPINISVEEEAQLIMPHEDAQFSKFLDKALLEPKGPKDVEKVCSDGDIEDAKEILRLLPICSACLGYAVVISQAATLFTKQGATMDRYISSSFQIPAASLQSLMSASIALFIPIYDRILVPITRAITQRPSGISVLQRIGIGISLTMISMVIAASIERKRLETAFEFGLFDLPKRTVPMSVWWLVPQYMVLGMSEVFVFVGLQEFVYDKVPKDLKSLGIALCLGTIGVGNFLSSLLISVIDKATSGHGQKESWFSNNLNRAHLDYFYWLLAGINAVLLVAYVYFVKSYYVFSD